MLVILRFNVRITLKDISDALWNALSRMYFLEEKKMQIDSKIKMTKEADSSENISLWVTLFKCCLSIVYRL
ncbi:hypothetical protein [Odoribacter lunatus]|uniref:hypothetical protein n=1 Tax=Odoribacter lunatus TaxID=2941335 RepID=UPI00203AA208|nr:hypothetical protein [Odoribacter lunatus]